MVPPFTTVATTSIEPSSSRSPIASPPELSIHRPAMPSVGLDLRRAHRDVLDQRPSALHAPDKTRSTPWRVAAAVLLVAGR
jgi:hypothetical protein